MPQQKPVYLDENGNPIVEKSNEPIYLDDNGNSIPTAGVQRPVLSPSNFQASQVPPQVESPLNAPQTPTTGYPSANSGNTGSSENTEQSRTLWQKITEPPQVISDAADATADYITKPTLGSHQYDPNTKMGKLEEFINKLTAQSKGFSAGALKGMSGFLNPLDVTTGLLSMGVAPLARRGMKTAAEAADLAARTLSLPVMGHGAQNIYDAGLENTGEAWGQRGLGLAELAGGALGLNSNMPKAIPEIKPDVKVQPGNLDSVADTIVNPPEPNVALTQDKLDRFPPDELIDIVNNVTKGKSVFRGVDGNIITQGTRQPIQSNQPKLTQGNKAPELITNDKLTIKHGDTVELADADGNIWWEDKINEPGRIEKLNEQIRKGEIDLVQRAGGIEPKNVTPNSLTNVTPINRDSDFFTKNQSLPDIKVPQQGQLGAVADSIVSPTAKPRLRLERDGTYTNLDTGEVINRTAQQMEQSNPISEMGTSSNRNSIEDLLPRTIADIRRRNPEWSNEQVTQEAGILLSDMHGIVSEGRQDPTAQRRAAEILENTRTDSPILDDGSSKISEATIGGKVVMAINDRKDMISMIRKTYKGNTIQTAGKELIQNALDAAKFRVGGEGTVSVNIDPKTNELQVSDTGDGLTLKQLKNEFIDLTASGKRGKGNKTIGEMGLGKITYLTTGEKIHVVTVVKEKGKLLQHEFTATPEDIVTNGVKFNTIEVPAGTSTGTKVTYYPLPEERGFNQLAKFLKNLQQYSGAPVPFDVNIIPEYSWETHETIQVGKQVTVPRRLLGEGTSKGANYKLFIPEDAKTDETDVITLILSNRGMFQGAQEMNIGGKYRVPDRIVVEIDPIVGAESDDYPLTAPTRESMQWRTNSAVKADIQKLLIDDEVKKKQEEMARIFSQLMPPPGKSFALIDRDGVYTPEEINKIANNKSLYNVAMISNDFIDTMTNFFRPRMLGDVVSFGFVLDEKTRGINVESPDNSNGRKFAIMLNPNTIIESARNPGKLADAITHVLMHEFNHTMARTEGKDFTSALADLITEFGAREQLQFVEAFENATTRLTSQGDRIYNPEILELLSGREAAKGRIRATDNALLNEYGSESTTGRRPDENGGSIANSETKITGIPDPIAGTTIKLRQPTEENINKAAEMGYVFKEMDDDGRFVMTLQSKEMRSQIGQKVDIKRGNPLAEAYNLPRGVMSSMDMSAPFRQGLGFIHKKAFWTAIPDMVKAYGSERVFQELQANLAERPLFKKIFAKEGKAPESFAEKVGLALTDLNDFRKREEALMSTWAERIPGFGRAVRASNRAYTIYLNKLRADVFESMVNNSVLVGKDAKLNIPLAESIAEFVNTATGRSSLDFSAGYKNLSALNFERAAGILNGTLFAPRLIASRLKLMNPMYYVMAAPQVRKEALKSLFAIAGTGTAVGQLAKYGLGATVEDNPTSPDFGKVKFGDVRIDPFGGFQQYVVLANKLIQGQGTSSTSGKSYQIGGAFQGKGAYGRDTAKDVAEKFLVNKAHPMANFAWGFMEGENTMGAPFDIPEEMASRFVPIILQDLKELATENPNLIPLRGKGADYDEFLDNPENLLTAIPSFFGASTQKYGGRERRGWQ